MERRGFLRGLFGAAAATAGLAAIPAAAQAKPDASINDIPSLGTLYLAKPDVAKMGDVWVNGEIGKTFIYDGQEWLMIL